jgi:o-succinylbenzoate---CoA ligase
MTLATRPDPLSVLSRAEFTDEALVDAEGALSYAEIAALARARLDVFRDSGLSEGAPVAVVGAPTRDRVVDVLAAVELGAPLVMLHPRATASEREAIVARTRPRLVVDEAGLVRVRAWAGAPHVEGALAILHTSGTSGVPKAAVLSRRAFIASAWASAARLPLSPGDRWLLAMPLAHVGGLSIVSRSLVTGSSVALAGPFEAARVLDAIAVMRPTHVSLVPTMLDRLLDLGLERSPSLRAILLGGAACPERTLARALARGLPIRTTYGLTEACSQVTTARVDVRGAHDGSGEPLPGVELRIGAADAIQVRGPTLFDGYLGEPSPFSEGGWFETGDLGRLDERGRLHVLARRSDLIVTGGENVYPAEVEAALERMPGVRAACVFGTPDERWGQRVSAALVLDDPAVDPRGLLVSLREVIAPFKLPKAVAVLESLVLHASGKLDREGTAKAAGARLRDLS